MSTSTISGKSKEHKDHAILFSESVTIGNWRQRVHLARKMTAVAAYNFSTSSPVRYRLEKMITQANQSTENGNPKQAETINFKKTIHCWYLLEIRVVLLQIVTFPLQ